MCISRVCGAPGPCSRPGQGTWRDAVAPRCSWSVWQRCSPCLLSDRRSACASGVNGPVSPGAPSQALRVTRGGWCSHVRPCSGFIRHSGEPGQSLGTLYTFLIVIETWKACTHLDFCYLNPPRKTAGSWLLASYHVLHSVWQILDCPSRWHATLLPQIKKN